MRLAPWTLAAACLLSVGCKADKDGPRFVERAPLPRVAPPNTLARAGNPNTLLPWAIPTDAGHVGGGYVGGGRLFHGNRPLARGEYSAPGAAGVGTYGTDYIGMGDRPGRVFLAPSPDARASRPIADNYEANGPQLMDVFNIRPVRKAVLEKREDAAERRGEGHE